MAVSDVPARDAVREWAARLSALRSWWFVALAAGAALRLFCALFVSNSLDMRFYAVVATDGQLHKPLYADGVFSYPPLWGYVLHAVGKIALLLHIQPFVRAYEMLPFTVPGLNSSDLTTPAMSLLIKLPIVALDVVTMLLILDVARRLGASRRAAQWAALAWWLNPVVIFCSVVNASWDAVVPFVLLATVLLAYTGRWFSSGVLVSLGVMAKLTPIYAGFIALAMALRRDKGTPVQRALWLIAGGVACALVVLVPVMWWHELAAMRAAVFTRAGTFVIGGPNIFAFTALLPFHAVRDVLEGARSGLSLMTSGSTLIAIVLACLLLVRIRVATFVDYLYVLIGLVSVVLIVTPYTQPTYAIWVLPAAVLLAACGRKYWTGYALCLTLAATVFVGTIRSPFDLITPLCYFAHACNPVAAGQHAIEYRLWAFPFAENFQIGVDAVIGQIMCFIYIAGLVNVVAYFVKRVAENDSEAASQSAPAVSSTPLAVGCGALALTMLAVMLPAPAAPLLSVSQNRRSAVIASAGFAGTIHATRAEGVPAISTIYVYFDNRYAQGRGVSPTFIAGFAMHLSSDLQARSLPVKVLPTDAAGLPAVLTGAARGVALTVMGGILPSSVRSKGSDLLQKWIARGGLVFWAGEPFDVLFSQTANGKQPATISPPDYSKWRAWYAVGAIFPPTVDPYTPPVMHGTTKSVYWNLARLTFGKTTFACNTGPLLKMGGYPLAFVDSHVNSSVSTIPYGQGRVVFFGDGFDDEILAADSVAQIVATDVWYQPNRVREYDGLLSPDRLPMTIPKLPRGAHVFAYGNVMPDGSPFTNIVMK